MFPTFIMHSLPFHRILSIHRSPYLLNSVATVIWLLAKPQTTRCFNLLPDPGLHWLAEYSFNAKGDVWIEMFLEQKKNEKWIICCHYLTLWELLDFHICEMTMKMLNKFTGLFWDVGYSSIHLLVIITWNLIYARHMKWCRSRHD